MYLAIDIGTSSFKAALKTKSEYWVEQLPLSTARAGLRSEQDPIAWLEALGAVLPRLFRRAGVTAEQIKAISVSSHSPSLVPVDRAGHPLYSCLTWEDRRAVVEAAELGALTEEFVDPSFFAAKVLWFKRNEAEVYARTHAFLQPKDFVINYLTGEQIIDRAAAGFSQIDSAKFPRPVNNWEIAGCTNANSRRVGLAAGIPVVAGGIDAYCEALGAGLVENGQFGDVTGTSTCLSYCLDGSRKVKGMTEHVIPGRFLYIMPMSAGGGTLSWFLKTLAGSLNYADIAASVGQSPPGAKQLLFLPYLSGGRSPIWNEKAQGAFFGISSSHTRDDFLRAALEGVAFAIRHNIEHLREIGLRPSEVRATGGGSRLKAWNQIKADITGLPYYQLSSEDGALLGGILLASSAVEKRSIGDLVRENVSVKNVYVPNRAPVYDELFEKYKNLYQRTKDLMGGS